MEVGIGQFSCQLGGAEVADLGVEVGIGDDDGGGFEVVVDEVVEAGGAVDVVEAGGEIGGDVEAGEPGVEDGEIRVVGVA